MRQGLALPGWDDDVGIHVNLFWAEMLRREEEVERAKLRFSAFMTYVMTSMPDKIDIVQRNDILDPVFDDVLSKLDHSAYTIEKRVLAAGQRLANARAKVLELKQMKWLASEDFSISKWLRFEDVGEDV